MVVEILRAEGKQRLRAVEVSSQRLNEIVAQREAGFVAQVPIEAAKQLGAVGQGVVGTRFAGVVLVAVAELGYQLCGQGRRQGRARLPHAVGHRSLVAGHFGIHKEKQLVFPQGPAQPKSGLKVVVAGA